MTSDPAPSFGALLRSFRLAAGLTQEALAERAGLSARGVSSLEGGQRRVPYPHTVRQLARALHLSAADRARLEASLPRRAAPPAPAAPTPATNLPASLTSFIGREQELAEVRQLLGTTRLLTLTGAGGVGKTRLALEAARASQADYPDGVWLVELAALADPTLVPRAVARALGVREQPGQAPTEALAAWLRDRSLLLVLDNCEHLVDACAALAEALLRACPDLPLLTTSREALGVGGERAWRIPSLAAPAARGLEDPETIMRAAAARLFVERAIHAQPDFTLTARNAPLVAQLCRRLDGIPLALELAAARVRVLSVDQIAARLDDCFHLLAGGSRTTLPRQQTLRATLDWSHALLTETEQILFRRLAVFAGGWTLEAAEVVGAGEPIVADDVLDLLTRLVDKSLVQVMPADAAEVRYRLLETVRQYAAERLRAAGEELAVRDRHRDWCLELAQRAKPELQAPDQIAWLERLEAEHDNLRAALGWCRDHEPRAGLQLAGHLGHLWRVRHHHAEGRRWLDTLLARAPEPAPPRLPALVGVAILAREQGDLVAARARLDEALTLGRALGDAHAIANIVRQLGVLHMELGDLRAARAYLEEGLALGRAAADRAGVGVNLFMLGRVAGREADYRRARALLYESLTVLRMLGDRWRIVMAQRLLADVTLNEGDDEQAAALLDDALVMAQELGMPRLVAELRRRLGRVALWRGDLERAAALYEESLTLARALDDRPVIAWPLAGLGWVAHLQGDTTRATALLDESLALFTAVGEQEGLGAVLHSLGLVAASQGDPGRATGRLRESLALRRAMGEPLGVAECLEGLAMVAAGAGQPERAARLLGAAGALREAIGAPLPPVDRPEHAATVGAARAALGEATFAAAWAAGRALTLEAAVAEGT